MVRATDFGLLRERFGAYAFVRGQKNGLGQKSQLVAGSIYAWAGPGWAIIVIEAPSELAHAHISSPLAATTRHTIIVNICIMFCLEIFKINNFLYDVKLHCNLMFWFVVDRAKEIVKFIILVGCMLFKSINMRVIEKPEETVLVFKNRWNIVRLSEFQIFKIKLAYLYILTSLSSF